MIENLLRPGARPDIGNLCAFLSKQGHRDFIFGADVETRNIHRAYFLLYTFGRDQRLELNAQPRLVAIHGFDFAGTFTANREAILPWGF